MQTIILVTFFTFIVLRLITVVLSAINEKKLKKIGAIEYGKPNSTFLIIVHFGYYFACIFEGIQRGAYFYDTISYTGLGIYIFSIGMLYYVIYSIRHVWTVKLIIAPQAYHTINKSPLFKYVRHPNYFLNIIPELIGIALFFHAWITLVAGMIIYLIPLITRIRQEEAIMKETFAGDY